MKPGLKIGVVGKGGVGKTTISSLLARTFAGRGLRVVAVDTDSNPNLGVSLGLDLAATEAIPVLPRSLVVGRHGDCAVDELLTTYGVATPSGVTVLSALRVDEAEVPDPGAGELLVRLEMAGVCGSDIHRIAGDLPFTGNPVCFGHEGGGKSP